MLELPARGLAVAVGVLLSGVGVGRAVVLAAAAVAAGQAAVGETVVVRISPTEDTVASIAGQAGTGVVGILGSVRMADNFLTKVRII